MIDKIGKYFGIFLNEWQNITDENYVDSDNRTSKIMLIVTIEHLKLCEIETTAQNN